MSLSCFTSKILSVLVWLFFLASTFGLAGYFWLNFIYLPDVWEESVTLPKPVEFTIKPGASPTAVAMDLAERGVVADAWALLQYLKKNDLDQKIEAGYFNFSGTLNIPLVAQKLQSGGTQQLRLTVLEGWTAADIDEQLVSLGLIQPNDFALFVREGGGTAGNRPTDFAAARGVTSLEGYLFPATYFLDPANFSVEDLVEKMLATMAKNLQRLGYDSARTSRSLHEILTLASIIELEEHDADNRPLIADLLWRRLDSGIALGTDATLFYTLGHKKVLTAADLALDNPYNTRLRLGLPPTPVGAPSSSAIAATLHPQPNDFWYYLHDTQTGEIHFGRTLSEHNQNKAKFIR